MWSQYEDSVSLSDIARALVSTVGICWIRKRMIPKTGRGRLAELSRIYGEIHPVSWLLQVAPHIDE